MVVWNPPWKQEESQITALSRKKGRYAMKRFIIWLAIFAIVAAACSKGVSKDTFNQAQDKTSKALSSINQKLDQLATTPAPSDSASPTGTTGANGTSSTQNNGNGQFTPSGSVGAPVNTNNVGSWQVQEMKNLVKNPIVGAWIKRLKDPAPQLWKTYPNVPNPDVPGFRVVQCQDNPKNKCVPDGAEFGTYSWPFCQLDMCNIPVPAREYVIISGDYRFLDLSCGPQKGMGCLLLIFNVGDQSFEWKHQSVDAGFAVHGRYWNGDVLEWAAWGLVSNASASMLNKRTFAHPNEPLNFGKTGSNAGANCSSPTGCNAVDATIVVAAGSEIIAVLHTVVHG